jgi:hypothetical protein
MFHSFYLQVLPTYMTQSHSWKAYSRLASQEIPFILWNLNAHLFLYFVTEVPRTKCKIGHRTSLNKWINK